MKKKNIALIPWGAFEQHGAFLSNRTDTIIAEGIAKKLQKQLPNAILLDALPYGVSKEHRGWRGTVSIDYKIAIQMLEDMLISVHENNPQYDMIVIINGHGGNQEVASLVCRNLNYQFVEVKYMALHVFSDDTRQLAKELFGAFCAHADSLESSVVAYLTGELEDKIYYLSELGDSISPPHSMSLFPVTDISHSGVVSKADTIIIDKAKGERLIKKTVENLKTCIISRLDTIEEINQTRKRT